MNYAPDSARSRVAGWFANAIFPPQLNSGPNIALSSARAETFPFGASNFLPRIPA